MSMTFVRASSQYLSTAPGVFTCVIPYTIAVWFYTDSNTVDQTLFRMVNTGTPGNAGCFLQYGGGTANDPINWTISNLTLTDTMLTNTAPLATNTWHSVIIRQSSNTSRTQRYNGVNVAGSAANVSSFTFGTGDFGRFSSATNHLSGGMCKISQWNVALTDDECVSFEKGFSSKLIRPSALMTYVPGVREIKDFISNTTFTNNNSVGVGVHPRTLNL